MLLAWRGCPAFTGIRTTLSPTTTLKPIPQSQSDSSRRHTHANLQQFSNGWKGQKENIHAKEFSKSHPFLFIFPQGWSRHARLQWESGWAVHSKQADSHRGRGWEKIAHRDMMTEQKTTCHCIIGCIMHAPWHIQTNIVADSTRSDVSAPTHRHTVASKNRWLKLFFFFFTPVQCWRI